MTKAKAGAKAKPSISFRVSTVMDRGEMIAARKHDMRLGPQPGYVDGDKSAENTVLSLTTGYDLLKSAWSRHVDRDAAAMEARRLEDRKAKAMWRAGIITFSTEAQALLGDKSPELEAKAAFEDFAKRHAVRLLWAIGHHDESSVHYHAMFENIRADGRCLRLNATDLSAEQELAAGHFAHLGLVRGTKKADRIAAGEPPSKTINRSVKQLHADLPAEIEALEEKLATAQARADKAEAKAQKFEGDADVAQARLERYQAKIKDLEEKIAKLNAISAKVPKLTADDLKPAVLKKRDFLGDIVEEPEMRAARVNQTIAKAFQPLVQSAQRVLLAETRANEAEMLQRASEADAGHYRELTAGLQPADLLQIAQLAEVKRAENKRLAAEQALVDEAQRRADALPSLLKKASGAALTFVEHAIAAIKKFGGHLAVDWKATGSAAVRESTREHGQSHESAFKAVFDLSPGHVRVTPEHKASELERARGLDAKAAQRPATPTPDSDYRP